MAERTPKPLGDVLTYLDGLGFDHLYVSRPSTATVEQSSRRPGPSVSEPLSTKATPSSPARPPTTPEKAASPGGGVGGVATPPAVPASSSLDSQGITELPQIPERPLPEQRAQLFEQIAQAAASCNGCGLHETRKSVVFGSGTPNAELMLIGEGPGSEEDRQGLPFVGPAGALLTRILQAIELRRDQVYITNVVKCRPPRNRDPKPDEVVACSGYLQRQIALVQPKVIVSLGRVAAQALLDTSASLGSLRGRWHKVQGVETRVTYHPAALLRNESWKRPTWEDMKVVRARLQSLS